MSNWKDVAEKAAAAFCRQGVPPTETIKRLADDLTTQQIKRACEASNHLINAALLKTGSRYPQFPLADPQKIRARKRQRSKRAAGPIRRQGNYRAGDELRTKYYALFDKIAELSAPETPQYEPPSVACVKLANRDVRRAVEGELYLNECAVEKAAHDFVKAARSALWETPVETVARAVIDHAQNEGARRWALHKVAKLADAFGDAAMYFPDGDSPAEYEKEAGLVPAYRQLDEALDSLQQLQAEWSQVQEKLAQEPDEALDSYLHIREMPLTKLAFIKNMLGSAFMSGGMGALSTGMSVAAPSMQMNAMKAQYDAAGFGQPPSAAQNAQGVPAMAMQGMPIGR